MGVSANSMLCSAGKVYIEVSAPSYPQSCKATLNLLCEL